MNYSIRQIDDRAQWDTFLAGAQPNTFLHSWEWGEFNEQMGERTWRLGIYKGNVLYGVALIIKVRARRGSFLFCPHGPIFATHNPTQPPLTLKGEEGEGLRILVHYLRTIAQNENCSFMRFSPLMVKSSEHEQLWHGLGFREAPIHMHPELAWILDITPSEQELLASMRKTTRYSIRKAEKDGVQVTMSINPHDIEKFWSVYSATVDRQHFIPFSKEYLRTEFEIFAKQGSAVLFLGTYQGEVISAAFIVFQRWSAFYHHGASIPKYTNVPASQLIQWQAILEAKKRGCTRYNFWGIAPAGSKPHPWAGLTVFKKGFGGSAEEYIHAKDLALSPKYWVTYLVERMRKYKRRL